MGKRQRKLKSGEELVEDGRTGRTRIVVVSSDDEVEKSLQLNSYPRTEGISDLSTVSKKDGKKGKTKRRKSREDAVAVEVLQDPIRGEIDSENKLTSLELFQSDTLEDKQDNVEATDISINAFQSQSGEKSENAVLRKLLRGPRYFDPPDTSWGACYNCGEEGHSTINCPSEKRRKPCYVCGSYDHIAKRCTQGLDCFICQSKGHRAKDCPDKHKGSKICLKCGDLGHNMFSCRNEYSSEDLKEIECYICGKLGHICCADYTDPGPREVSCYRCGLSGHTGLACKGYNSESNTVTRDNSCFKCGLLGHFSRECPSSKKAGKKNSEPSTPKQRSPSKKKYPKDIKSPPINLDKMIRKKNPLIPDFVSAGKLKQRGGWMTEHPDDSYSRKSKHRGGWLTKHPDDSYSSESKHRGGWSAEQPSETYRGSKKKPRFLESPHDRRSIISIPSGHHALSTPSSSQNHYQHGFHRSPYHDTNEFYHQNGFSAPEFVQRGNCWNGRRQAQW